MNKIKIMWILNILMWLCWLSAVIVNNFSHIAYWILLGCWAVCVIAIVIVDILIIKDLKRQEQVIELKQDEKYLEELITRYLAISLESENENKEDQE